MSRAAPHWVYAVVLAERTCVLKAIRARNPKKAPPAARFAEGYGTPKYRKAARGYLEGRGKRHKRLEGAS